MEKPLTHPLEVYAVYILLAVAVTFYLNRNPASGDSVRPGSSFGVMFPIQVLGAFVFLGLPGILISALPHAVHPRPAIAMTIIITLLFTAAFVALVSMKLLVAERGITIKCLHWEKYYAFEEFKTVTVFRANIVLERKTPSGMNPAFPAIFSNIAGLNAYLKDKIENDKGR
jgi:hypothetical protein